MSDKVNKLVLVPKSDIEDYFLKLKKEKISFFVYKTNKTNSLKDTWVSLELTREQLENSEYPKP